MAAISEQLEIFGLDESRRIALASLRAVQRFSEQFRFAARAPWEALASASCGPLRVLRP